MSRPAYICGDIVLKIFQTSLSVDFYVSSLKYPPTGPDRVNCVGCLYTATIAITMVHIIVLNQPKARLNGYVSY